MSEYNPFSLSGKIILVTGASSGIGRATAIECSKMGAKLVITGRNVERLQDTFKLLEGDGHLQVAADLTHEEDSKALISSCPMLNGVVLCAGGGITAPLSFATREKFDKVFDLNFFAPLELMRLALKNKKILKGGSIVFVSSVGGNYSFNIGNGIYGSSKAALTATMKFYARELASKRIRANSINPGMVNTKLIRGGAISDEQLAKNRAEYPLGRFGEPEEIAHGIVYLLSDAAAWITGHALVIDGGYTI